MAISRVATPFALSTVMPSPSCLYIFSVVQSLYWVHHSVSSFLVLICISNHVKHLFICYISVDCSGLCLFSYFIVYPVRYAVFSPSEVFVFLLFKMFSALILAYSKVAKILFSSRFAIFIFTFNLSSIFYEIMVHFYSY